MYSLVSFQGDLFPSPHFEHGIKPSYSPSGLELVSPENSLPMKAKGPVPSLYGCHMCRREQKMAWHGTSVCLFQRRDMCTGVPGLMSCRPSMFLCVVLAHTCSLAPCLSVAHIPVSIFLLGSHQCRLMVLILCTVLRDQRN